MDITFIIPALNEQKYIGDTLAFIDKFASQTGLTWEAVVMDNGSTDNTVAMARSAGASVIEEPDLSISGLRNAGAKSAKGDVLVFVDADIFLTSGWAANFPCLFTRLKNGEKLISGSQYSANVSNFFLKHWYNSVNLDPRSNSLPGGHMIVSRKMYDSIGGQNESLAVGEDFEFCQRATTKGFKIENNQDLKVIHDSTPTDMVSFFRRQRWHGSSDFQSLQAITGSKVAIGSVVFVLLHLYVLFTAPISTAAAFAGIAIIAGILLATSIYKFHYMPWPTILINAATCYVYYLGRACSAVFPERRALVHRK